jgi:hypothetical protein
LTTAPAPHTFTFTGQAHGGLVPDKHVVLVLDTNVVSALQTVATKGIRPGNADAERVAHLLRWLHDRPDAAVSALFGVLEGSGLHQGVLRPFGLLQRAVLATTLIAWGRQDPEPFIASAAPPPELLVDEAALDPTSTMELAELLLPWTVLSNWVLVALVWQARRQGHTDATALRWVGEQLASRLDFVPGPGWLACTLLLVGQPQLRKDLEEQLFKFGRDQPARDIPAAAWDLGYLGLLSIARAPQLFELFNGRAPVLVSADRGLVRLARQLPAEGNSAFFALEIEQFDPALANEAIAVVDRLQRARIRRWTDGAAPTWEGCAALIVQLHSELGLPALNLHPPTNRGTVLQVGAQDLLRWLKVLDAEDGPEAIRRLEEVLSAGDDLATAAVVVLNRLIDDNAAAHRRSREDSWHAVLSALPENAAKGQTLQVIVRLAVAAADGRWAAVSAWAGKLSAHGGANVAELWLWYLTRAVLSDTATARGAPVADLVARLRIKMESYGT